MTNWIATRRAPTWIVLSALALVLAASASGQVLLPPDSARAHLGRLTEAGLLADSTAAALATCIADGAPVTRPALIGAVEVEACRRSGRPACGTPLGALGVEMVAVDSTGPWQRVVWADSLAIAGLISDGERRAMQALLDSAFPPEVPMPPPVAVVQLTALSVLLAERERLSPGAIARLADHWEAAGVLGPSARRPLVDAARTGDLAIRADAVAFSDAAIVLDLTGRARPSFSGMSRDSLAVVLRHAADLLRARGVADLTITDVAVDSSDVIRVLWYDHAWVDRSRVPVLAVRIDGRLVRQHLSIRAPVALLNRVLLDRGRAERLYAVRLSPVNADAGRVALIVLTPEQLVAVVASEHESFLALLRYMQRVEEGSPCATLRPQIAAADGDAFIEFEGVMEIPEDPGLTTATVTAALDRMEAVGLFDGLSPDDRRRLWATLTEREVTSGDDLIRSIPSLVLEFEWESAYGPHPYADLLDRFAAVSRGAFAPTDVVDDFGTGADSVRVAFTHEDQRVEASMVRDREWLSRDVLSLIAQATEVGPGQFYRLSHHGDSYAYLSPAQHAALRDLGLIPPEAEPID